MKFGSLFAGIGGLDLGLERAGMSCAWQVEWDDYCQKVLARHWPDTPRHGDISEVGAENLEPVELICGGFPCQPVSHAGARAGTDDERWLWPQFHRIICELRPTWVVVENVPGLLSANSGRAMGEVLGDLAASGYDAVWDIFPAGGPGGVGAPHRRERVFILAHADRGDVADTSKSRQQGQGLPENSSHQAEDGEGQTVDAFDGSIGDLWAVEPAVGRVADGVPSRVDRLKCLGNAVVPQVAERIGRMIMQQEQE